jgi:hypothetical protein
VALRRFGNTRAFSFQSRTPMNLRNLIISLAAAFDRLYAKSSEVWLEHWTVKVSVAGFLVHLLLVFLARAISEPPALISVVGKNYLAAIYTPFSFILFYEVLMLIAALPQSTTQSIAKQFEIVSLIFIRRFFKDIAELDDIGQLTQLSGETIPVFLNVGAGLLMFLLVTVFLHAARRRAPQDALSGDSIELKKFISRKKVIALGLTILLLALAVYNLILFGHQVYEMAYLGAHLRLDPNAFFYSDVFAVMIFTDVLILILSLVVSDSYELVFRNAAFVISTILIRFSLTVDRPYGAVLALAGMVFGILTLLIYNYHTQIRRRSEASSPSLN